MHVQYGARVNEMKMADKKGNIVTPIHYNLLIPYEFVNFHYFFPQMSIHFCVDFELDNSTSIHMYVNIFG